MVSVMPRKISSIVTLRAIRKTNSLFYSAYTYHQQLPYKALAIKLGKFMYCPAGFNLPNCCSTYYCRMIYLRK